MQDKPKMYQNKLTKEFHNNKTVFKSYNERTFGEIKVTNSNEIRRKVENIINSNSFIYSKMVHILIGNDIINKKIIGIYNNNLVTIDNEYIPIDNIKDIYT